MFEAMFGVRRSCTSSYRVPEKQGDHRSVSDAVVPWRAGCHELQRLSGAQFSAALIARRLSSTLATSDGSSGFDRYSSTASSVMTVCLLNPDALTIRTGIPASDGSLS